MYQKNQVKFIFEQQGNAQYGITTSMEGYSPVYAMAAFQNKCSRKRNRINRT